MKLISTSLRSFSQIPLAIAVPLCLFASVLIAGCGTTESAGGGSATSAFESIRQGMATGHADGSGITIAKGMSKAEVVALMGEPAEIDHLAEGDAIAEIWTYSREVVVSSTIESAGEQERVIADPDTGAFITIREEIYRNEDVRERTDTKLLFNGDELIAFKEEVEGGIVKVTNPN